MVTKGHTYLNKPAAKSYSFVQACTTPLPCQIPTPPGIEWLHQIKTPMEIYLLKVNNRNTGNKVQNPPKDNNKDARSLLLRHSGVSISTLEQTPYHIRPRPLPTPYHPAI